MVDRKLVLRYLKVRALAEAGSPGERDNAARIQGRLEQEHPALRAAADRLRSPGTPPDSLPPGFTPKDGSRPAPPRQGTGNWENLFRYAQQAVTGLYDFAETAANAQWGTLLASQLEGKVSLSRVGNVLITLRLPGKLYAKVRRLNSLQRQAFRDRAHEELDEQLDSLLGAPR